jgi:hypothetical protein
MGRMCSVAIVLQLDRTSIVSAPSRMEERSL